MVVKVGTGGERNLDEHRKSAGHQNAMVIKKKPTILKFFAPREPPIRSSAPVPPKLQTGFLNVNAQKRVSDISSNILLDRTTAGLTTLRSLIKKLPSSIPEGSPDNLFATFSMLPDIDDPDEFWENGGDKLLNNIIGYEMTAEDIVPNVCKGKYGIDCLVDWIEYVMSRGISEALLEGKITRLVKALQIM